MKKEILILFAVLSLNISDSFFLGDVGSFICYAQFPFKMGAATADIGYGVAVDGSANVYVTGYFQGTADFDPGSGTSNLTSTGSSDIFIAKYNSGGAYLWAFSIGAASSDYGYDIAVDASANVYVTGSFQGTADFDPGAGTANLTSASNDIFVAKYNTAGAYTWAINVESSTGNEFGYGIAVDSNSNVYVTGYFYGTADFDPGAGTVNLSSTTPGSYDIFVAKYNSAGTYQWAFNVGSTVTDYGYDIALDNSANVYVTGHFQGTADFDPGAGTVNLTAVGGGDIFVAKYNSAGAYQMAFAMGGGGPDWGYDIVIDASANMYVTGSFQTTSDFDPGISTANLISSGFDDIFVAKYNSSGVYQWAFAFGTANVDVGSGISLDGSSNAYVTGYYTGTVDFDPGASTANLTSAGSYDIFVAKYNSAGIYQCAFNVGGTSGDRGYGIALDGNANVYITGSFLVTADFDPGASTANLTSAGDEDIYLSKYNNCLLFLPIELIYFNVFSENKKVVRTEWATATEINNDYFSIERSSSPEGGGWEGAGSVKGAGNSSAPLHYEFVDEFAVGNEQFANLQTANWQLPTLYYRLKQTDYDGKYEYFGPVSVTCNSENEIMILPSISDNGYFSITGLSAGANVTVYNLQGKKIYSTATNDQPYILNISNFTRGIYFVSINNNIQVWNKKIVFVK